MTSLHYLVEIPPDRAPDLQQALRQIGTDLHLQRDMVALRVDAQDELQNAFAQGKHIPETIDKINKYLSQQDLSPMVRQDHQNWTPDVTHAFLKMAVQELCWAPWDRIQYIFAGTSQTGWDNVVTQYPNLFQQSS